MRASLVVTAVFLVLGFRVMAQAPGGAGQGAGAESALENYQIGRDLESRNRMNEADSYYNAAIRICQDEVARNVTTRDTYAVITWAMQRQSRYADVIIWGERGLRLYSDEYRVLETMGEAYFYLGEYNRSLSFMQRYANAVPQGERTSVAYFFIGEIFRLTRRFRHADIAYTTAVRLEPNVALWWYRLAAVREAAGDREPAVEACRQALRLNPGYQEAADALTRLQTP